MSITKPQTISEYIASFSPEVQAVLQQIRETIQAAAPKAKEAISYGIPTFQLDGNLVHFGAFKEHIGFYALPSGNAAFQEELAGYKVAKGSVQFPLSQPIPLDLIRKIVAFRVQENQEKALKKKTKRTCKNGHNYFKSSDCPVCPTCEKNQEPTTDFLALLAAPARRALENKNILTLEKLASCSEKELLTSHGFGKASLPALKKALAAQNLSFKA